MRVLIVEDEKPLRDSIVEQLQQHGFNVDAAADGEEGLYCAREYALDLAIVDLGLPVAPPRIGAQRGRELMGMDKKVLGGRIRLVLLQGLGRAVVADDYPEQVFEATLQGHFG